MDNLFNSADPEEDSEWLSVSDLMAGLMIVFLFIAIIFIRPLAEENQQLQMLQDELEQESADLMSQHEQISEIAVAWQERENQIYEALLKEFGDDLENWNAEIERETLLIRFKAPEVLFESGAAMIRQRFAEILADFFPRYVEALEPFKDVLEELRIEGHTSSTWHQMSPEDAYIENMRLSQDRTRAVLEYVLGLSSVTPSRPWLQKLLTANGLSSSHLAAGADGTEDHEKSRRVEFRIRTTIRSDIIQILDAVR